jgi:hypothetical protein
VLARRLHKEEIELFFVFREVSHSTETVAAILGLDSRVFLGLDQRCDHATYEVSYVEVVTFIDLGPEVEFELDFGDASLYLKNLPNSSLVYTKGWHPAELLDDDGETNNASSSDDKQGSDTGSDYKGIWMDDRTNPIYIRGDTVWSRKNSREVDQMLLEHRPDHFPNRVSLAL